MNKYKYLIMLTMLFLPVSSHQWEGAEAKELTAQEQAQLNNKLIKVAKKGNFEFVKTLVKSGADVDARDKHGKTVLMHAARGGHFYVVEALVNLGADVDARHSEYGFTALSQASSCSWCKASMKARKLKIIKFLVEKGAKVDHKDSSGETALMVFSDSYDFFQGVKTLVKLGADVNEQDKHGRTALMRAARWTNLKIMKFLIDQKAKVDARDREGRTALMYAAGDGSPVYKRLKAVKFLVEKGAKVDAKDKQGRTVLMHVVRGEYNNSMEEVFKIMEFLVEKGANVNAKDRSGRTVLSWVNPYNVSGTNEYRTKAVEVLVKLGAKK